MTDTPHNTNAPTPDDPMLTAYALGELDPDGDDARAIRARLEQDADARAYVEQARAIGEQLTDKMRSAAGPGLDADTRRALTHPNAAPIAQAIVRHKPGVLRRLLPYAGVAACAALATAAVIVLSDDKRGSETPRHAAAGPDAQEATPAEEPVVADLRRTTRDRLAKPIQVSYNGEPLQAVLADLAAKTGTDLAISWPALGLVGIDDDLPIIMTLDSAPAEEVLRLVLDQASADAFDDDKAGYRVEQGFVRITTRYDLKADTDTRVYDINELLGRGSVVAQLKGELLDRLAIADGDAGPDVSEFGAALFADSSRGRANRRHQGAPMPGEPIPDPAHDPFVRAPNFSNAPGFDLNDALMGTNSGGSGGGGGGLFADDAEPIPDSIGFGPDTGGHPTVELYDLQASRDELIDQYTELIQDTVGDPDEWLDMESTLTELNGRLIVKTTPENHAQIELLLAMLDPEPNAVEAEELQGFAALLVEDVERGLIQVERRRELRELERERRDRFAEVTDNPFKLTTHEPLSTFSVDVDTASYAYSRRTILEGGTLPMPDAVRIEEWINYFDYGYEAPVVDPTQLDHGRLTTAALAKLEAADQSFVPFATDVEVTQCPWADSHQLVRVGIKAMEVDRSDRPAAHLVLLLDVSGSMQSSDKLALVKAGMPLLLDQLNDDDKVSIVVYAGASGLVLEAAPAADKAAIRLAIDKLTAGGSTAGGAGIQLAYDTAQKHFVPGGINRVILCTDGDFNVGTSNTTELVELVKEKANPPAEQGEAPRGVYLSVMGFGRGNLNDAMMEKITNAGNGNYHYIDSVREAVKALSEQAGGTLITVAKDVKIQVEFNPAQVASYRLIGYENRVLRDEDFNDDTVDAGDIGAGHNVTALYEVVPAQALAGEEEPAIDKLRYQQPRGLTDNAERPELMTLKLRYKPVDAAAEAGTSRRVVEHIPADAVAFEDASEPTRFAASVAAMGMILRGSPYRGTATTDWVMAAAADAREHDPDGFREQFVRIVGRVIEIEQAQLEAHLRRRAPGG